MFTERERKTMTLDDIQELMDLKFWTRTKLASELDLTENTVHQWFSGRRNPGGPAVILMRLWLDEEKARRKRPRNSRPAKAAS